jgi:hypothetical protein
MVDEHVTDAPFCRWQRTRFSVARYGWRTVAVGSQLGYLKITKLAGMPPDGSL